MGRQPAIRIHLVRRQRDDSVRQRRVAKPLERVEEVAGVGGHLLHVAVGGDDDDGQLVGRAVGAQGDVQRSGRRRQAGDHAAVEIQTGFRRGRTEQRPKCEGAGR